VAAIVAAAQDAVAEREEVLREIVAAGWELLEVRVRLAEHGVLSSITASGTYAVPGRPGVESFIRLRVRLWEDGGVMETEAEDPSHGVAVFIDKGDIPTPDEAVETYHRKLRQLGQMVTHGYKVWKPYLIEATTG